MTVDKFTPKVSDFFIHLSERGGGSNICEGIDNMKQ